jgi:hypothetical protein
MDARKITAEDHIGCLLPSPALWQKAVNEGSGLVVHATRQKGRKWLVHDGRTDGSSFIAHNPADYTLILTLSNLENT